MRTLFLKGHKAKLQRWHVAAWACGVVAVLLTLLALLEEAISWHVAFLWLLAAAVIAGLAILVGRWVYRRRLQDSTRSLKDSALW
jgi:thiosulfate reductase cytochrome b subunit